MELELFLILEEVLNQKQCKRQLYKLTSIESSFGFNTLAIVDGRPKVLNLKEFISEFVDFREKTVVRRIKFDLKKTEERAHILIGIATAVENIDRNNKNY